MLALCEQFFSTNKRQQTIMKQKIQQINFSQNEPNNKLKWGFPWNHIIYVILKKYELKHGKHK